MKIKHGRRVLSVGIALLAAMIVEYYVGMAHGFLVPLVALFVMQTASGNLIFQSVLRLLVVMSIIVSVALLSASLPLFYVCMHDALLGAFIGWFANVFIFPRRASDIFRAEMIPLLKACERYSVALIQELLTQTALEPNRDLELALLKSPRWVYTIGFDCGLRPGHQFFLSGVEQLSDLLFSLHHLARHRYDPAFLAIVSVPINHYADKLADFFAGLVTLLALEKATARFSDLQAELKQLEQVFQALVSSTLELIDLNQDEVYFAEWIYGLQDLNQQLFKLAESLRVAIPEISV